MYVSNPENGSVCILNVSETRFGMLPCKLLINDESFYMFYELVMKKAESHKMVEEPKTGRKRTKPNYSILQYVDGYDKGEAHHPTTPKDQFTQIYFEAIDYFIASLKERF